MMRRHAGHDAGFPVLWPAGWSWPEPPAGATPHRWPSAELCPGPGPAGSWGHERPVGWRCLRALPLASVRAPRGLMAASDDDHEEGSTGLDMFCGIDWAEDHHDVALVDRDGQLLARRRISDDAAGLAQLLELLVEHGDSPVYPFTPLSVARYRDRHTVAGRKSDHGDDVVLANILRTDRAVHRPLPADSELAQAIAVLARAQQDAVWDRTTAHNKLRSHLREYYPGFLAAFADTRGGILRPEARTILAAAPTPAGAARLTQAQLRALLRKAGRSRGIDTEATRLHEAFRLPQMRQLPLVEQAMGKQALALLGQFNAACTAAADLEHAA